MSSQIEDLIDRAKRAYRIAAKRDGSDADRPDSHESGIYTKYGFKYVVLKSATGVILAVYRIRNDGALKRYKRIPEGMTRLQ